MKSFFKTLAAIAIFWVGLVSATSAQPYDGKRPKLVVGVVVDQMRWDYLYRYYDRYGSGGFKKLITKGFSAENTLIPYAQTVTAAGHACVYTGSVPAINGIMGNDWYDKSKGRNIYCVEDNNHKVVGGSEKDEPMSPANLLTTTIGDELRLATNFKSKVVGVAIKDRGSILPAGHTGTAYWYEAGNTSWVSSTYYMQQLPEWVKQFNSRKLVDSFYAKDWHTLYPINTYTQSDNDDVPYEALSPADKKPVFPHLLQSYIGKNGGAIRSTPFGNTLTLEFAKAALKAEGLGKDDITDLLAISFSSPDYIGHQYGPNSIEAEDTYLRLDKDIEDLINTLDKEVGKDQWTLFLTADHAVAHTPAFLKKNKIDVSTIPSSTKQLNKLVEQKFGMPNAIVGSTNYQLYLNDAAIDSLNKSKEDITQFIISELMKIPQVMDAFDYHEMEEVILPAPVKEMFANGYNRKRAGDIQLLLKPGYFFGGTTGTTHGSWYPYDSHIPVVFMGWGIQPGRTNRATYMSDIAPTLSALLHIQMPSGSIGSPIIEILPQH